jgi:hypothetical protein
MAATRCLDLAFRPAEHGQAEADIFRHGHVWKQGVTLENGVDRSLEGRHGGNVSAVQHDLAGCRIFEAGDQPQKRGLAAARWPRSVKNSFCRIETDVLSTAANANSPKPNILETLRISTAFNSAICGTLTVAEAAVPAFSALR